MRPVVAIGGAGKWFSDTYAPLLAAAEGWRLRGVVDLQERLAVMQATSVESWPVCPGDSPEAARGFIEALKPALVVVSTGPETHAQYCTIALQAGADVICDKPPVALAHQFSTAGAGRQIALQYEQLLQAKESARRRGASRPPHVFIPLRRRRHRPFGWILAWLAQVHEVTGVVPTSIDIAFNDGSFRCAEEYDRPGAHGYRDGLGVLTHTGYHFIDFAAACLGLGQSTGRAVRCTRLPAQTAQDSDGVAEHAFFQMLGRTLTDESAPVHTCSAEVDARMHLDVQMSNGQTSRCNFALMHHGCTRREATTYAANATHDEGRVDDLNLMIQQGAHQSIQLLICDNAGGAVPHGHCVVVRRVHPVLARQLQIDAVSMQIIELHPGDAAAAYAGCLGDFLAACADDGPHSPDLQPFTLASQRLTAMMYASYFSLGEVLAVTPRWMADADLDGLELAPALSPCPDSAGPLTVRLGLVGP